MSAADVWAIPSWPGYWIRPSDGALIHAKRGKIRRPYLAPGRTAAVHSARGTSRTVASLVAEATRDGAPPAAQFHEDLPHE